MNRKVVKSSLLMLFIAEIMLCVSSLAFLNIFSLIAFFKYAALSGICAYILIIVAVIRLRNTCGEFRQVFWCAIACIALSIVSFVIGFILDNPSLSENAYRGVILAKSLLSVFSSVIGLFMIIRTIDGCAIVSKTEKHLPQAKLSIKLFVAAIAVAIITYIVETVFAYVEGPSIFLDICSVASIAMRVTSEVLYIMFIYKSYKEVEVIQ